MNASAANSCARVNCIELHCDFEAGLACLKIECSGYLFVQQSFREDFCSANNASDHTCKIVSRIVTSGLNAVTAAGATEHAAVTHCVVSVCYHLRTSLVVRWYLYKERHFVSIILCFRPTGNYQHVAVFEFFWKFLPYSLGHKWHKRMQHLERGK